MSSIAPRPHSWKTWGRNTLLYTDTLQFLAQSCHPQTRKKLSRVPIAQPDPQPSLSVSYKDPPCQHPTSPLHRLPFPLFSAENMLVLASDHWSDFTSPAHFSPPLLPVQKFHFLPVVRVFKFLFTDFSRYYLLYFLNFYWSVVACNIVLVSAGQQSASATRIQEVKWSVGRQVVSNSLPPHGL